MMIKKRECDNFIKNHSYLSDKAKNIALVSSMFPLYKEIEIYPFIYQDKNKKSYKTTFYPLNSTTIEKKLTITTLF